MKNGTIRTLIAAALLLGGGCALHGGAPVPIDLGSSAPGATVSLRGETHQLVGTPLQVGRPLPATALIDAFTMEKVDISQMEGKVLILSVVPSIDTKVCELQTHYLGEKGARLPRDVVRIVVSRDTPFAQKRFAEEAKLGGLTFLSDYKEGAFGRATGLLIGDNMLLARSVVVVDKAGIVRYIQVVPELSHLPDMEAAFAKAAALSGT
ncbi:thiol peroxidase [Geobacter sp. AOG2]|uniref:thiol peroxidase n=1 Tax=Geobacter sp. AOG2 TaxID=1566347 RepID=UPI001CC4D6D2|nr:thiol peroxidase [Geobacter sp. AOG2]GFE59785.1 putative thiol peroxidase [Geobacter sp. AOG2]